MSRAQLTSTVEQSSGGVVAPFLAGKNKIINGDFSVWQRGTSFSNPANGSYTADRFKMIYDGTGATRTISQQTFTPGTAPVAGYEGTYFMRYAVSAAGTGNTYQGMQQYIEDVRIFAGQTITFSFWAKAEASKTMTPDVTQYFGSGGSANVQTTFATQTITTSWARYSASVTVPSIAGKTIGTGNALQFGFYVPANTTSTLDIWGVQLEAGSVATPFTTAAGTLQGELALAMRYYQKSYNQATAPADNATTSDSNKVLTAYNSSTGRSFIPFLVAMRTSPTVTLYRTSNASTNGRWAYYTGSWNTTTSSTVTNVNEDNFNMDAGGSFTQGYAYILSGEWTASAEL